MARNNKIYITANELAEMLECFCGSCLQKLIRKLNQELEKKDFGDCGQSSQTLF